MTNPVFFLKLLTLSANILDTPLPFHAVFLYKADHLLFYQPESCMMLLIHPQSKNPLTYPWFVSLESGFLCSSWISFASRLWIFGPISSVQFSSVAQLCLTLCDPMNHSMPGLPVHHPFPEFPQTHVHRVDDAIQPSHPLLSPSPPALNLSQHQGLFQWVSSSQQVAKVLEFQLQHQSHQWIPGTDLL